MKLHILMLSTVLLSGAHCAAMRELNSSTPAFLFTTCQMPKQQVIIARLIQNTIFDENDQETYNLSYYLANKAKDVVDIESTVVTVLRRHYSNIALQLDEKFPMNVPLLVEYGKKGVLIALLQDYPDMIAEFQKLWDQDKTKK